MTGKLTFLAGLGAGYVLGARAGRERYEQIVTKAQELIHDPRVQEKAGQAQHLAKEKAEQAQQAVKDMAGSHGGSHTAPTSSPDSSPSVQYTSTGGTQS